MKKSMRIKALLLALVMILSAFTVLASCNKKDNAGTGEETGEKTNEYGDNLPEADFEGKQFSVLIGAATVKGMIAEEETGDLVNDTVYARNQYIEERFNVDLNFVDSGFDGSHSGDMRERISSLIMANDDTYHAFQNVQHAGMPALVWAGNFVDWNELPYVQLDQPWWYQNIKRDLCFGDKIYLMTGDYALYLLNIDCLRFNKDIMDEVGLEYPYQMVKDGTWTIDKLKEYIIKGSKDLNGDGQMDKETDRWGLCGWGYELDYALLVGLGFQALEKDADNLPILNDNVELNNDKYDKIVNLYKDKQYAFSEYKTWDIHQNAWTEGRAMFYDCFLGGLWNDLEFDFGIVPFPMYNEEQGEYFSRSSNMTNLTYIPITNNDLEMTGIIFEALAKKSYEELTPTYFDLILTVRGTRDVESEEMLPIIRDSARFLLSEGYCPNILTVVQTNRNIFNNLYNAGKNSYIDAVESLRETLTKTISGTDEEETEETEETAETEEETEESEETEEN